MAAISYVSPRIAAIDQLGKPLVGGKLYTYENKTNTPHATYQDADGTTPNTNPIILDARGEGVAFLDVAQVYTFELRDASDQLIWTQDGIQGPGTGTAPPTPGTGGITVVTAYPITDVGPVYLKGAGVATWDGTKYVPDFAGGFLGGGYSFKNRLINGDFEVWETGASIITYTTATSQRHPCDQWKFQQAGGSSIGITKVATGTDHTLNGPGEYAISLTVTTPATPLATDRNTLVQYIEGHNVADICMGATAADPVTLTFWVKGNTPGLYSLAISNGGFGGVWRSFVATYTINGFNTWEKKQITIPPDSGGIANWGLGSSIGMALAFDIGSGSNYENIANAWLNIETMRTTETVKLFSITGGNIQFSKVQLERGPAATPFETLPLDVQMDRCKRFFEKSYSAGVVPFTITEAGVITFRPVPNATRIVNRQTFSVAKRAVPTILIMSPSTADIAGFMRFKTPTADVAAITGEESTGGFLAISSATPSAAGEYSYHYTASAQF